MHIELVGISLLFGEAQVLEEEENAGEKGVLEVLGVGEE
jgi:hypothetical protein